MYSRLSRDILINHGGLSRNCLIENMNTTEIQNENNNEDLNFDLIKKSNYHDFNQFILSLKNNQNSLNIMSINIQGINTSFSELQVLVSQINDQNLNLGIIALQECHLSEIDMNPFDLIGYKRISSDPVVSSFGGLTTYIRKIKKKYVGSKLWEGQFFEIMFY